MGDNAVSSSTNPSEVQGACPTGWHLPSDDEWKQLEMHLGMSQSEADVTGWRGKNQGSELADFVYDQKILRPFMAEAIVQLGTGEKSIPIKLGPVSFELGVIAGTANRRSMLPGFSKQAGDGTVTVAETIVPGMLDFLEMPVSHTFMMWNNAVLQQAIYFLNNGHFDRSGES